MIHPQLSPSITKYPAVSYGPCRVISVWHSSNARSLGIDIFSVQLREPATYEAIFKDQTIWRDMKSLLFCDYLIKVFSDFFFLDCCFFVLPSEWNCRFLLVTIGNCHENQLLLRSFFGVKANVDSFAHLSACVYPCVQATVNAK